MNNIIKFDSLTNGGNYRIFNRRTGQYIGQEEGCLLIGTFFGSGMRLPTTFKQQFENYYQVCKFSGFYDVDDVAIFEHDFINITDAAGRIFKMVCQYREKDEKFIFRFDDAKLLPSEDKSSK